MVGTVPASRRRAIHPTFAVRHFVATGVLCAMDFPVTHSLFKRPQVSTRGFVCLDFVHLLKPKDIHIASALVNHLSHSQIVQGAARLVDVLSDLTRTGIHGSRCGGEYTRRCNIQFRDPKRTSRRPAGWMSPNVSCHSDGVRNTEGAHPLAQRV